MRSSSAYSSNTPVVLQQARGKPCSQGTVPQYDGAVLPMWLTSIRAIPNAKRLPHSRPKTHPPRRMDVDDGNSPSALTGGKAPIWTNGRAASSLAGRARDGLVALEFQAAAFCARYGTSCALVLLLLCPGGALLVVAEADGVGHRGRRERRPRRGGVMQAAREGRRGRDVWSTRTGVSEGRRRAVERMDDSLPRDGRRRSYRGVPVTLAFHARPSLALPPATPHSFASAAITAFLLPTLDRRPPMHPHCTLTYGYPRCNL